MVSATDTAELGPIGRPGARLRVTRLGLGTAPLGGLYEPVSDALADETIAKAWDLGLRFFDDENGKMNLSLAETRGSVLAVSQFTLYGDIRKGRRPSFDEAAPPPLANELYQHFVREIREAGFTCQTGRFQAMMKVELVNYGPVTILLDSPRTR